MCAASTASQRQRARSPPERMAALVPPPAVAAPPPSRFKNVVVFCGVRRRCRRVGEMAAHVRCLLTPLRPGWRAARRGTRRAPACAPSTRKPRRRLATSWCGNAQQRRAEREPPRVTARRWPGAAQVRRRVGLIYGGGSVGIMGVVSRSVAAAGGKVLGVIPADLAPVEVSGASVGDVRVVPDMHTRKATMVRAAQDNASAFEPLLLPCCR